MQRTDALAEFWTTLSLPHGITELPGLSLGLRRKLAQRVFLETPRSRIHLRPGREVMRMAARASRLGYLTRHETGWASIDGVYHDLDRAVARRLRSKECLASAVYAYEDGALKTFIAAKDTGRVCIYDLPITHWKTLRNLLDEEAQRLPEWVPTMEGLRDSTDKHDRKDAEIELADHVIVASNFTRESLRSEISGPTVHITPYGCPTPKLIKPSQRASGGPIKLLFAGHLAQRKGIADLIMALDLLEVDWQLTLAGPCPVHLPGMLSAFLADERVSWLGVVPHSTLLEHMTRAHVFVFPSIVEGFGMVITEALSCGLPVITTPHTAGPDILDEGVDGFIVPIRNPSAIAERITWLAEDEAMRQRMANAALEKASWMSWDHYEARIARLITGWMPPLTLTS